MKKVSFVLLCLLASIMGAKAQVGYQIALLNTATGEARANETVKVSVSLSNSANEIFYSETKQATTNDFGVLSLTIGNADTFKDVDLTKMPFFIEVTANDVLIGKSQMLSVPMAEVAKRIEPTCYEKIIGTWKGPWGGDNNVVTLSFHSDGTGTETFERGGVTTVTPITFEVEGNTIYIYKEPDSRSSETVTIARYYHNVIYYSIRKFIKL